GAAAVVDVLEVCQEALDDLLRVGTAVADRLRVGDGQDGEAVSRVACADGCFKRIRTVFVAVSGQEDELLILARLPDFGIRGIVYQPEVGKCQDRQAERLPEFAPR